MKLPLFKGSGGTTDAEREVRSVLAAAIKTSGKDREAIAEEMSRDLGRDVTASMIRDFTRGASKRRNVRFPAAWVPSFCRATGSYELQRFMLEERVQKLLAVGESAVRIHGTLARALAEMEKIVEPPRREGPGAGKGNAPHRKRS